MHEQLTAASNEEWRPVLGYEGVFEVSSQARVRRISTPYHRGNVGHIYTARKTWDRYYVVFLTHAGKTKGFRLHRIVAGAFHGPPPSPKHEVNHIDGDRGNNVPSNLEWVTSSENQRHAYHVLGRIRARGERVHGAKLTGDQVRAIRVAFTLGVSHRVIGEIYGIDPSVISDIRHRKIWKHVR